MSIKTTFLEKVGLRKKWDWPISKKVIKYYDDHRNFHVDKFNLIIFRVSKVAGTSLWQKSAELLGYKDVTREILPDLNIPNVSGVAIEQYDQYFRAGFIRNPWDRLLSCYLQKKAYKRINFFERNGIDQNLTFEEFVMKVCSIPDEVADQHFRSQYITVINHRGEFMLNFLGQFENIASDYQLMADMANLPSNQLPVTNQTDHRSYEHYYTPAMQKAVAERYQIDLKLFKYQFGIDEPLGLNDLLNTPIDEEVRLQILKVKCAKMVEVIKRIQLEEEIKRSGISYKLNNFLINGSQNIKQGRLEPYDDHRNIYIDNQKLLIYKIPKVASTSLWKVATDLLGKPYRNKELRSVALPYIPFYRIKKHGDISKVGFVRNPWDRLVSCFLQKKKSNQRSFFVHMEIDRDISFPDFVELVCNLPDHKIERHLRSQFTYLIDHTGKWIVDFIGRFEYLAEDLEMIFEEKSIKDVDIPHANHSGNKDYETLYTPDLVEKVRARYALDIELFGYEFGKSKTRLENVNINNRLSDKIVMKVLEYKSEKLMDTLRRMAK